MGEWAGGRRWRGVVVAAGVRAGGALLVLLALATCTFLALRLLPGDPAALVLGDHSEEPERALLRARLGLDRSLPEQYGRFLAGLVRLDLGDSLARPGRRAFAEVGAALGPTAALAGLSVALGALAGVALAILQVGPWLGRGREWLHRAVLAVAATPLLSFAPVTTYVFAVRLAWVPLPGDPEGGLAGLGFAAALLGIPLGAQVARIGRAALLDVVAARFVTVAAAKGAAPARVFLFHVLPVGSGPITVVVATQLGALLGGAVVLERLFERPGLGSLMLAAFAARDLPVLEASVVAAGLLFVAAQGLAAAVHAAVDPRGAR